MANERCPRCFSRISEFATGEEALWTDDPIKTPKGEAGDLYKGFIYYHPTHIEEIQQIRQQQEEDLGFIDSTSTGYVEGTDIPKTTFTPVRIEGQKVYFYKKHLRELRESTEKILDATGQSKENYFNYDEEETEYNIGDHQLDWHDVDLTQKFLDIKAVHIEDLRHYLLLGWFEPWTNSPIGTYIDLVPPDTAEQHLYSLQGYTSERKWSVLGDLESPPFHPDIHGLIKIIQDETENHKLYYSIISKLGNNVGIVTFINPQENLEDCLIKQKVEENIHFKADIYINELNQPGRITFDFLFQIRRSLHAWNQNYLLYIGFDSSYPTGRSFSSGNNFFYDIPYNTLTIPGLNQFDINIYDLIKQLPDYSEEEEYLVHGFSIHFKIYNAGDGSLTVDNLRLIG